MEMEPLAARGEAAWGAARGEAAWGAMPGRGGPTRGTPAPVCTAMVMNAY